MSLATVERTSFLIESINEIIREMEDEYRQGRFYSIRTDKLREVGRLVGNVGECARVLLDFDWSDADKRHSHRSFLDNGHPNDIARWVVDTRRSWGLKAF